MDPLIKRRWFLKQNQEFTATKSVKPRLRHQWVSGTLSNLRRARTVLGRARRTSVALVAVLAGTVSPAAAAIFIHDGDLYFLGPDGSGFVIYNFVLIVVLLLGGLAMARVYDEWERAERRRRAQAEAWGAARYYQERADDTRTLTREIDAQTARLEGDIRAACERFEQDDREEARRHENAKRALAERGERS